MEIQSAEARLTCEHSVSEATPASGMAMVEESMKIVTTRVLLGEGYPTSSPRFGLSEYRECHAALIGCFHVAGHPILHDKSLDEV